MNPQLHEGEYVFSVVKDMNDVPRSEIVCAFREVEGVTIILERRKADQLNLSYDYVASWITLTVSSSLAAVGLTAAFSTELAQHHISCNVVAGYYHDHIFVDTKDKNSAMQVLRKLSKNYLA